MTITRRDVKRHLEAAGATLMALPGGAAMERIKSNMPDYVRDGNESYGWNATKQRPPRPTADAIDRMDRTLSWVRLIPASGPEADTRSRNGGATLRRIVHARLLVDPLSYAQTPDAPKYLIDWTRLARMMGADVKAVKLWHGAALGLIADRLEAKLMAQKARK